MLSALKAQFYLSNETLSGKISGNNQRLMFFWIFFWLKVIIYTFSHLWDKKCQVISKLYSTSPTKQFDAKHRENITEIYNFSNLAGRKDNYWSEKLAILSKKLLQAVQGCCLLFQSDLLKKNFEAWGEEMFGPSA